MAIKWLNIEGYLEFFRISLKIRLKTVISMKIFDFETANLKVEALQNASTCGNSSFFLFDWQF